MSYKRKVCKQNQSFCLWCQYLAQTAYIILRHPLVLNTFAKTISWKKNDSALDCINCFSVFMKVSGDNETLWQLFPYSSGWHGLFFLAWGWLKIKVFATLYFWKQAITNIKQCREMISLGVHVMMATHRYVDYLRPPMCGLRPFTGVQV